MKGYGNAWGYNEKVTEFTVIDAINLSGNDTL